MAAVQRRVDPQWPQSAKPQTDPAHQKPEKHLIIAGTGRAGTSFLVRYLTELGLDTTLARHGEGARWDSEANAGLESLLVSGANLPYVVKSPWISEYVDQILNEKQFRIDAFIVPVRDLVEAATSRVVLEQRAIHQHNPWMADQLDRTWETYGHTAGGLVYSLNPLDQARLLAVQFHQLVLKVAEAGIPIVFRFSPGSRPTGTISTNACGRSCRLRFPKTWRAPPTPESPTPRRSGLRARSARTRPGR
jgi:hypothetical protein